MRTAIALALALAATASNAQPLQLMPPHEYDHPYTGANLEMVMARDQAQVRELCPRAVFSDYIGALACSMRLDANNCRIIISPAAIKARGLPLDVVLRHETAHCNGWPADHKGALFYDEWAEEPNKSARGPKPAKPVSLDQLLFGR
jgi:hypothetical protein